MKRVLLAFLLSSLISSVSSAGNWNTNNTSKSEAVVKNTDVWKSNSVPNSVSENLQKAGLNSIGDWSGCKNTRSIGNSDAHIKTAFNDGWSHFVFIVCIDQMFPSPSFKLQMNIAEAKINALTSQIDRIVKAYPNKLLIISLKSREPIGGWNKPGVRTTHVYDAFEKNEPVRADFTKLWQLVSKKTQHIPNDNLAFNLMNEPEFHNVSMGRRDRWGEYASAIVKTIREISPGRTIIFEGVLKSLLGRKHSPADLMPVLNQPNIVYGFHFYEPDDFVHWKKPGGRKFTSSIENKIRSSMRAMVKFSNLKGVPVVLSEVGVWGPYPSSGKSESGVSFEDRAKYAEVIAEETLDKNIGVTWWALLDNNTPYKRAISGKLQKQMEKDPQLWKALRLEN